MRHAARAQVAQLVEHRPDGAQWWRASAERRRVRQNEHAYGHPRATCTVPKGAPAVKGIV